MSKEEQSLVIVPVTLQPIENMDQPNLSKQPSGFCTITLANAEITFKNGVEERIIQMTIKELISR